MAQGSKPKKKTLPEKPAAQAEKRRELQDPAFSMKESDIMSGVRATAAEAIFGRKST